MLKYRFIQAFNEKLKYMSEHSKNNLKIYLENIGSNRTILIYLDYLID